VSVNLANKFCSACANPLIETAVICPKCGSPTSEYLRQGPSSIKSKTTAVVLAVFLGIWSWLYTYELNKKKFWVSVGIFGTLSLVFFIRDSYFWYRRDLGIELETPEVVFTVVANAAWLLSPIGLAIWAIIDNASKSSSWYEQYPTRKIS